MLHVFFNIRTLILLYDMPATQTVISSEWYVLCGEKSVSVIKQNNPKDMKQA